MGSLDEIKGSQIYLDANVFIHYLELFPAFTEDLDELFEGIDRGAYHACTSELSLAETLVKPIRDSNQILIAAYEDFLAQSPKLKVIQVTRAVLIESARLRAEHVSLKLPDAIHAATALRAGCSAFITNDRRFQVLPQLGVRMLSEVGS